MSKPSAAGGHLGDQKWSFKAWESLCPVKLRPQPADEALPSAALLLSPMAQLFLALFYLMPPPSTGRAAGSGLRRGGHNRVPVDPGPPRGDLPARPPLAAFSLC